MKKVMGLFEKKPQQEGRRRQTRMEALVTMLVVKCAACKRKLWKYDKIGQGHVLRCHKDRVMRLYGVKQEGDRVKCVCGKDIGIDKGNYIKMIGRAFTHTGTKRNT